MSDDRVSLALTKFSKGSKSGTGSKEPTDKQKQQKRDASRRNAILAASSTPQAVKDKWAAILAITQRGKKNAAKAEFTELISRDAGQWQHAYWQAATIDSHSATCGTDRVWMLRSKAETEHGGAPPAKPQLTTR